MRSGDARQCKHCGRWRCAGICRRERCPRCGRQRCYGCQSEAAAMVRKAHELAQPERPELNPSQDMVLRFIHRFIKENKYSPSIEEIMQGCGYRSSSTPTHHLLVLQSLGYITRSLGQRIVRSIALTEKGEAYCEKA